MINKKDNVRLTTLSHGSGWACKISPKDLTQVLGNLDFSSFPSVVVNHEKLDDAAVVRLDNEKLILQTVDFFTPVVDNPYDFGQIAAANSLSDIYAMGGKPLFALNIVGFPINELPKSILGEILQGGIGSNHGQNSGGDDKVACSYVNTILHRPNDKLFPIS